MSSFSSPLPLAIPFKFRRKSSSVSTSVLIDNIVHSFDDAASPSSPLLSSSPLLTPLHLTRKWQAGDYFDDLDEVIYDQRDNFEDATHPWSCRTRPEPPLLYIHRPLPSLMTKFTANTLQSDAPLSCSPSPFSSVPQTTCFYPQGDSAIADDCEEYDLEGMDIHIRETYFATSAERGRWLSSPIASRVQSQAIPPMRGYSSPIKTRADASPPRARSRRRKRNCSVDKQILTSSSEDRDEDLRCSSPLPPSSPFTSPISNLSFLGYDCEDDSVVDPHSNSDDCHSSTGTPELSFSSITCTSPTESTHMQTPNEALAVPALHPTDFRCHSPSSVISHHTNPCPSRSPQPIDVHVHAPDATSFEFDGTLSPLSQFELEPLETEPSGLPEPSKLPLSDTVNKHYPGQHTASLGVTVGPARCQEGLSCSQSLSMNSNHIPLDVTLDTVGGPSSDKRARKRREFTTGNSGAMRTKKRTVIRSGSPSSNAKKRRGMESYTSIHSEPPSKKSKLSHCRGDSESRAAKSLRRRGGLPKVERLLRSPSRPTVEGCNSESIRPRDRKTPKPIGQAQPPQPTPRPATIPISMNAADVEFHASLTGMLIEAFATSRATSMDSSALYLVLTQAHPYLAAERSKEEFLIDIATVLEAGRARCGMFEKVDSSGERTRHKALESRWFYIPERDEDSERASLISAIMPRQKRNETKKYKQYYYRPLDKICRWDAEDAP
ncbi:hypothetical protein J3R83DRAFT_3739 [Lanmaoa asiatica]|nr:hypothetical protein J3R83DRAFT_3739 [Lanmaoa asiatica]